MGLILSACSYSNTDAATLACVYNGGMFDSKDFRSYKDPGSGRENIGVGSVEISVPTRLITYQISRDPALGDTPTADELSVNVGGMVMGFEPKINMKFNTGLDMVDGKEKPKVCSLYETHLKAFEATDFNEQGGKWQFGFLSSRARPSIDVAGKRVIQSFNDPIKMYYNTVEEGEELGYRDRAANKFGAELSSELDKVLGDEYFCGPKHSYKSDVCDQLQVTLPQPEISESDLAILSAPQRARTEANAEIAKAKEAARQAQEVASARTIEAESAKEKADADEEIAREEARTVDVAVRNELAWCAYARELGEECWKLAAAENGGLPKVLGSDSQTNVVID